MKYSFVISFCVLSACSTTRALEQCDAPTGDCCTENAQCIQYFGSEYPFCANEHCVQCTSDEHCADGEVCIEDPGVGYFCGLE